MIKILKVIFPATLLFFQATAIAAGAQVVTQSKSSSFQAETKIVGGEEAIEENWPWMAAYVVTFNDVTTSLAIDGISYETEFFTFAVSGEASGEVVNCGIGDIICADATGKVCLIQRGEIDFSEKADNCEAGGGIGAIIYNNEEGIISGSLTDTYTGTIPVVAVTQAGGQKILNQVGQDASLSVNTTPTLQQDATCGGTFLGDKWVLTAAHCADSDNARFLKMNVGEYDLSDGAENAIDIANIYIHPFYDAEDVNNDIAIIELVSSVNTLGIEIADPELTDQYAIENSIATVAGWGGRQGYAPGDGSTSDFPDILHQVDLRLSTNQQCRDEFAATFNILADDTGITDVMICAAVPQGGRSSCQGDSGGPLVVINGSGVVQQVGIVSWGFGCAEAGYPGVFTRVSEFKPWLKAISEGIAITQRHDFAPSPQNVQQSVELEVSNNSESSVNLTFEMSGDSAFSLNDSNCSSLAVDASCQLTVNFEGLTEGEFNGQIIITTDNQTAASYAYVTGYTVATATELVGIAGESSTLVTWFSGGDLPWVTNAISGVESGAIDDQQDSILLAQVEGEGELTFEWSVSSEENTEDPNDPFDALYLYVNGELELFISGEVDFRPESIPLPAGSHLINWTYSKDFNAQDGEDKGFVRNVLFTVPVVVVPPPTTPTTPTPPSNSSSGGGTVPWSLICILGVLALQRARRKK
jgi:secreted trypsin-like serine protease